MNAPQQTGRQSEGVSDQIQLPPHIAVVQIRDGVVVVADDRLQGERADL